MSSLSIHHSAVVEDGAVLADGVRVGPHSFIEAGAVIGENCEIGSSVWISGFTKIGKDNKIFHCASIGAPPQDLKFNGEPTTVEIGDNNVIREFATIHRGTKATCKTIVGSDNLLMAYVHIAHDCRVGSDIVMANCLNLAGHVTIDDHAILGGLLPIHQFCHIGSYVMLGTGAKIVQDILPYSLVGADPTRVSGINRIGLERRGFSEETMRILKNCFRIIYYSKITFSKAVKEIEKRYSTVPEVKYLLDFISKSQRGITLKK
ncbi:acyl-ACP--UDP-N-acetylglucosamine O-acyltransferase [bacterium]|nr:acyl-ACP--UDP-N-acetylglucosamine O-acyltransferase [bacterium]